MQTRMTAAEFRLYMMQQSQKKQPKHRNKIVYVFEDGYVAREKNAQNHGKVLETYGSVKEYNRWNELKLFEKAGKVSNVRRQVPFILQDEYESSDSKKHKAIYYVADFVYERDNKHIVEDVKGQDKKTGKHLTTSTFRIKWKLLQAKYPEYTFELY